MTHLCKFTIYINLLRSMILMCHKCILYFKKNFWGFIKMKLKGIALLILAYFPNQLTNRSNKRVAHSDSPIETSNNISLMLGFLVPNAPLSLSITPLQPEKYFHFGSTRSSTSSSYGLSPFKVMCSCLCFFS